MSLTGRTLPKFDRFYCDGYDLSGYSRTIGPLEQVYDEHDLTADMGDTVKGYLPGHLQSNVGVLNAVFDNTATIGLHALMATAGAMRTIVVARGIRAAPAAGDPAFCGQFVHKGYQPDGSSGAAYATLPFSGMAANAATLQYGAWGVLLHENAVRLVGSGANTGSGVDNPAGKQTTHGGFFIYEVLAGDGAATLSVDNSASVGSGFSALSGATSGSIACAAGVSGVVALAPTATVKQYLRWQIAFGAATTVTFVSCFVRGFGIEP